MEKTKISAFENTKIAFALKSDRELRKSYFLFKMMGYSRLVRLGSKLINLSLRVKLPIKGLIKKTIFTQFCGGISEQDCMPIVRKLYSFHVGSVLDYAVEGESKEEEAFDKTVDKIINMITISSQNEGTDFSVFKPTGIGSFDLYVKASSQEKLNEKEIAEWERIRARYDRICRAAFEMGVPVLVDAEHSWMQGSVDKLVEEKMQLFNKEKAIVYGTLQMYRWDRLDYLKSLHEKAENEGFYIGMKIVRGAYMELERERASRLAYPSPICSTKEETDRNYNEALSYMWRHVDRMALFVGTHNELSILTLIDLMVTSQWSKEDKRVFFSQLYGMSDHISFNLGEMGYRVAKYLPFGPVEKVTPYLIRRAEENTSIAGQTGRELSLIIKERKRRKLLTNTDH